MAFRKNFLRFLLFIIILFVGIFLVSSRYLKSYTRKTFEASIAKAPFDAIIIPGIPYDSLKPRLMLKVRMYWAKKLFDMGLTRNIIFSGAAVHTPFIEGGYMKTVADSLGIPSEHTFVESEALHGTENAEYGFRMAQSLGFKKVALATDPFQSFFLLFYSKINIDGLAFLPFPVDSMPVFNIPLPKINPAESHVSDFTPLKSR